MLFSFFLHTSILGIFHECICSFGKFFILTCVYTKTPTRNESKVDKGAEDFHPSTVVDVAKIVSNCWWSVSTQISRWKDTESASNLSTCEEISRNRLCGGRFKKWTSRQRMHWRQCWFGIEQIHSRSSYIATTRIKWARHCTFEFEKNHEGPEVKTIQTTIVTSSERRRGRGKISANSNFQRSQISNFPSSASRKLSRAPKRANFVCSIPQQCVLLLEMSIE